MANAKAIRTQIRSIQSTQKITHAMEMVAASKMRKAQERMRASRPYFKRVKEVIGHLVQANLEYTHPFLRERPVQKVGYLVVATDRGLCGGLNQNLFKSVIAELMAWEAKGVSGEIYTIGKKAEIFFSRHHIKVAASITNIGDEPKVRDLLGIIKVATDSFLNAGVDKVFLSYNEFVSAISQKPQIETLFPIVDTTHDVRDAGWDYIYEPNPAVLLDTLLNRYIESLVYQGAVENVASEQAARMVAMKNATDNAGDIIDDLKLIYNKARQSAITKELAEIVAGAAAV